MNLFGVMEISGSALKAERIRAEVVAANMANAETTRTADGGPYRRQHVVFQQAGGDGFAASLLGSGPGQALAGFGEGGPGQGLGSGLGVWGPVSPGFGTGGPGRSTVAMPVLGSTGAPGGVQVSAVLSDQGAPLERYDPTHPDAGPDGYVAYPDINPLTEMVDLMGATRSYGLNATAVQAEKGMIASSLELLK